MSEYTQAQEIIQLLEAGKTSTAMCLMSAKEGSSAKRIAEAIFDWLEAARRTIVPVYENDTERELEIPAMGDFGYAYSARGLGHMICSVLGYTGVNYIDCDDIFEHLAKSRFCPEDNDGEGCFNAQNGFVLYELSGLSSDELWAGRLSLQTSEEGFVFDEKTQTWSADLDYAGFFPGRYELELAEYRDYDSRKITLRKDGTVLEVPQSTSLFE